MAESKSVTHFVEVWFEKLTDTKACSLVTELFHLNKRRSSLLSYRKELILKSAVKCNQ